jgi:hypothetical protein
MYYMMGQAQYDAVQVTESVCTFVFLLKLYNFVIIYLNILYNNITIYIYIIIFQKYLWYVSVGTAVGARLDSRRTSSATVCQCLPAQYPSWPGQATMQSSLP